MKTTSKLQLTAIFLLFPFLLFSQERNIPVNTDWDHERHAWEASWITHPTASVFDYGVFYFRNSFIIDSVTDSIIVYVSADNRYRLFVNGIEVSNGPARGMLEHWRYETIDISPWLQKGKNVIAAEVFNLGEFRPVAQFSHKTAFILQAEGNLGIQLNTGINNWVVTQNTAYSAIEITREMVQDYYVAGPCDRIDGSKQLWGWETQNYDDSAWQKPKTIIRGVGRGYMHGVPWLLTPRTIPPMERKMERIPKIVRSTGINPTNQFLNGKGNLQIPANSKVSILLDQTHLTIGYPEMIINKGKGSIIKVTYAEALIAKDGSKGNRNISEGKEIRGYHDIFLPDGSVNRKFRPLWLRCWRFIQLDIETKGEPLEITDYYGIFTAYPLTENASFVCNDNSLTEIWNVGWRTAKLCAGETYMDCPYWEQLQYIGDTRLQSLISLYVSGDDRLMRNALTLIDDSRIPEGLTMARTPTAIPQITPPFSLYWIDMVHDYSMHRDDTTYVKQFLPGIQSVLGWFERRMDNNGLLGGLDWLNFTDWTPGFMVGSPAGVDTSNSSLVSLNYAYALDRAAELFAFYGKNHDATIYLNQAKSIKSTVYKLCFNTEKQLLKDTPFEESYSQHTNIWGVLTDAIPLEKQKEVIQKVLSDKSLIQCTIYFRFYLFQAMKKVGLADEYLEQLGLWRAMIAKGLTTFEEGDYDERSDCHAWGSTPNYDLLATVCGIRPAAPGFTKIEIAPAFGKLTYMKAKMPHPKGLIEIDLRKNKDGGVTGFVIIPENTTGIFRWYGKTQDLNGGKAEIEF
jgi:alpha-L-rhamnosidase